MTKLTCLFAQMLAFFFLSVASAQQRKGAGTDKPSAAGVKAGGASHTGVAAGGTSRRGVAVGGASRSGAAVGKTGAADVKAGGAAHPKR